MTVLPEIQPKILPEFINDDIAENGSNIHFFLITDGMPLQMRRIDYIIDDTLTLGLFTLDLQTKFQSIALFWRILGTIRIFFTRTLL